MRNTFKAVFVIIGTIIGAGFATGKEIYVFFCAYGLNGVIALVISCLLLGLIIYKVLSISNKYKVNTYKEFLENVYSSRENNLVSIINAIVVLFLSISFIIMIAGIGEYFNQELNIPSMIGRSAICLVCLFILNNNTNGVVKLNTLAMPILIILSLCFFPRLLENNSIDIALPRHEMIKALWNAVIYASFNSIILIPVLINIRELSEERNKSFKIALLCIIIIALIGIILALTLLGEPDIKKIELPLLFISKKYSSILGHLYGIVILLAMLTSAVSLGMRVYTKRNEK